MSVVNIGSGKRPVEVGLFITAMAGGMRDGALRWNDIKQMATRAEEVGFDSFWLPDHLIFKNPNEKPHGPWECWSLLSAVAAVTHRVKLGTLVLCAGFRNPALLAKMADTVDEISAGRLILGIGAGWHEPEYSAFGYPFDHRVDRFEEAVTILSGLLRNGQIDFSGTYSEARDCALRPRGPRPGGPPIMIGTSGAGPRMLRLTARFADQWNVWFKTFNNRLQDLAAMREVVDAACRDVGRDPATLERTAALKIEVGPHVPSPMSTDPIIGSPAEIAETLRDYAGIGISHVQIWLEPTNLDGIAAFAPVLADLDGGPRQAS
jgi:probable F420-dependent oxidoreductase